MAKSGMGFDAGTVFGQLAMDEGNWFATLRKANAALDGTERYMQSRFGKIRAGMQTLSNGLLAAGTVGALGIGAVTKRAIDFEQAMRNVNSITGLSESGFKRLSSQVQNLFGDKPIQDSTALAKGLYDISSSGFMGGEGLKVLKQSAIAATAGMSDTATASKALTAVLNAYGQSADHAGEVSDILFQTVNKGVVTFPELANNIGDVVATSATAGVKFGEVGAALATLTKGGITASESVTALNQLLLKVIDPSEALKKVLKAAGYESGIALLQAKGLAGAVDLIAKASGGSADKIQALVPEVRAFKAAASLARNEGKAFAEDLRDVAEKSGHAGASQKAFTEESKASAVQLQIQMNRLSDLGTALGTTFLPVLNKALGTVGDWTKALSGASDKQKEMFANTLLWTSIGAIIAGGAIKGGLAIADLIIKFKALQTTLGTTKLVAMGLWGVVAAGVAVIGTEIAGIVHYNREAAKEEARYQADFAKDRPRALKLMEESRKHSQQATAMGYDGATELRRLAQAGNTKALKDYKAIYGTDYATPEQIDARKAKAGQAAVNAEIERQAREMEKRLQALTSAGNAAGGGKAGGKAGGTKKTAAELIEEQKQASRDWLGQMESLASLYTRQHNPQAQAIQGMLTAGYQRVIERFGKESDIGIEAAGKLLDIADGQTQKEQAILAAKREQISAAEDLARVQAEATENLADDLAAAKARLQARQGEVEAAQQAYANAVLTTGTEEEIARLAAEVTRAKTAQANQAKEIADLTAEQRKRQADAIKEQYNLGKLTYEQASQQLAVLANAAATEEERKGYVQEISDLYAVQVSRAQAIADALIRAKEAQIAYLRSLGQWGTQQDLARAMGEYGALNEQYAGQVQGMDFAGAADTQAEMYRKRMEIDRLQQQLRDEGEVEKDRRQAARDAAAAGKAAVDDLETLTTQEREALANFNAMLKRHVIESMDLTEAEKRELREKAKEIKAAIAGEEEQFNLDTYKGAMQSLFSGGWKSWVSSTAGNQQQMNFEKLWQSLAKTGIFGQGKGAARAQGALTGLAEFANIAMNPAGSKGAGQFSGALAGLSAGMTLSTAFGFAGPIGAGLGALAGLFLGGNAAQHAIEKEAQRTREAQLRELRQMNNKLTPVADIFESMMLHLLPASGSFGPVELGYAAATSRGIR